MISISFDNPYLLLLALPLALLVVIPFAIAIRRDNRNGHVIASLVLHLVMVAVISCAFAGMQATAVMTETNVYVVADVSYSANRNLDTVDEYIQNVKKALPLNAKLGVICFGKDHALHTPLGEEITSVKGAAVDDSATNIADALDYAATLFEGDVLKRVVLITDGKQTDSEAEGDLIRAVENLHANHIEVDALYLDNNLRDGEKEVQISDVEYTRSTFLNHETTANVLIRSTYDTKAIVSLLRDGETVLDRAVALTSGFNIVRFDLDTTVSDNFAYEVRVQVEEDASPYNNSYFFSQQVTGKVSVLLISSLGEDLTAAERLYGDRATIDAYIGDPNVPCTVEDLCRYDEIVLANVDVRQLHNYTAFIESVDTVVSRFGKSLVTVGDLQIQNKTDEILGRLEDMLPVKFGNNDQDPKLVAIVIDTSRSMENLAHLQMAKQAAIQMLNLLNEEDYVAVVAFAGEVLVSQPPVLVSAENRIEIAAAINALEPTQGTFLGAGLQAAFNLIKSNTAFSTKQLLLISDGMSYTAESDVPGIVVKNMADNGIATSVINTGSTGGEELLQRLAQIGYGNYYFADDMEDLEDLILGEVADDITESIVKTPTVVNIDKRYDDVVTGVSTLPHVTQYVYARLKASATNVLTVNYLKQDADPIAVPYYSYWSYGNGRVTSFTGGFGAEWIGNWEGDADADRFLQNILTVNTPRERIDYPYNLNVDFDGTYSTVELIPGVLTPGTTVTVTVTLPTGETITEQLIFDSARYFYKFATPHLGKYDIHIVYAYANLVFEASSFFTVSYSPEYDSFTVFDPASLHRVVRNRGTVTEDGQIEIRYDENEVVTYTVNLIPPFLIAAVALFVIDIIIRKLKWADIKSLFVKIGKKGEES